MGKKGGQKPKSRFANHKRSSAARLAKQQALLVAAGTKTISSHTSINPTQAESPLGTVPKQPGVAAIFVNMWV
jgi:hypothetical protein